MSLFSGIVRWRHGFPWVLLLVLVGTSLGGASEGEPEHKALEGATARFRVELTSHPSPPVVGENEITVRLRDIVSGQGVGGATLKIDVRHEGGDDAAHGAAGPATPAPAPAPAPGVTPAGDAVHGGAGQPTHGAAGPAAPAAPGASTTGEGTPGMAGMTHGPAAPATPVPGEATTGDAAHGTAAPATPAPVPAPAGEAAHGESPSAPQSLALTAGAQPGEYSGKIHFDAAGTWKMALTVDYQGTLDHLVLSTQVVPRGANLWVIGGFVLVVLFIIVLASLFQAKFAAGGAGANLLNISALKWVLKSRLYPFVLQYITLLVFSFIVYELLFGPASPHDNFGTAMTWVLWWPLIPLLFLALGRFWCAICPFATLSDLVQKVVGRNRKVPNFLKKYGIWIIDATFIFITWGDHIWGIVESPRGSGVLLVMIIAGVVTAGVLFERRTWCRHLCFLGGLSGNYARSGALELRATPEKCAQCRVQACYRGGEEAPGCPMFEFPKVMDTNARCNLCAYCIKNCPNDSIRLTARIPSRELWFIKKPKLEESFLAVVIMGIVFVQNITMLEIGRNMLAWLAQVTGTDSRYVTFTLIFLMLMLIPILALLVTGWVTGRSNGKGAVENFTILGYALIPLDLAGHLAHNLFHLLAEGKAIYFTFMGLIGEKVQGSSALLDDATIQILQYLLVALGILGSLFTTYYIARNRTEPDRGPWGMALPMFVLILLFGVVNYILFSLPMEMRM